MSASEKLQGIPPRKAIYPGVIIRIDHDYQEMTYKEINDVYNIMTNIGKSGVDIDTDHQYQVLFDVHLLLE